MARVIKAGAGGQKPARPPTRVIVDAGAKKVIEREVFQAKQDAEHILMRAEQERQAILADGKKLAARAREEAMARGASEAFAAAAAEALAAFRKRAERYGEAADDIRALALEVAKKVLGNDPDLGPKDVDKILQKGMAALRARRRLRVQVSPTRLQQLQTERPNLMKALQSEPDLVVEDSDDVGVGFARVVTEIGGALCAEENALDALAMSVNVKEQPRQGRASTGITNVGTAPTGVEALKPTTESVPDAAVEEIDDDAGAEDEDETLQMSSRSPIAQAGRGGRDARAATAKLPAPATAAGTDDVEEIEAEEDSLGDEATAERPRRDQRDQRELRDPREHREQRVPTGQVQVSPNRAATRVVPIDPRSPSKNGRALRSLDESMDSTMRQVPVAPMASVDDDSSDVDEDLDLFTDDAVTKSPRKRR